MSQQHSRPTLHIIAGPNGAGKTTLYRDRLVNLFPNAELVNADELVIEKYGHTARTDVEAAMGQQLADNRRRQLFDDHRSIITESTFSHPSKVDLVRMAISLNYEVILYHINIQSAELSVARVNHRVNTGGHCVPEEKIRQRYQRNQSLIRQAVHLADRAYIFDNSALGKTPVLTLIFDRGRIIRTYLKIEIMMKKL